MYFRTGDYDFTDNNSLVIVSPEKYDAAVYTCIAKTALDSVQKSVRVEVDGAFSWIIRSISVEMRDRVEMTSIRICFGEVEQYKLAR